ncbi:hypothetical protein CGLO_04313 [Colletotrichum gloeosporioides Cg-14]|uniref:Uncharacterized protein n=1 Tax=Colletotrichum gloeosporioides (strain Cg-14) TaxID=1237896 RepID=T0KJS2_COLGC|nr:hypothetical protein CGLO_04313 [Colletotrichum gloeosporioides Cg-14]
MTAPMMGIPTIKNHSTPWLTYWTPLSTRFASSRPLGIFSPGVHVITVMPLVSVGSLGVNVAVSDLAQVTIQASCTKVLGPDLVLAVVHSDFAHRGANVERLLKVWVPKRSKPLDR